MLVKPTTLYCVDIIAGAIGNPTVHENKMSEMCLIMDAHHKYTCVPESQEITSHERSNHRFHKLLNDGDQLTVARVRGTNELLHT